MGKFQYFNIIKVTKQFLKNFKLLMLTVYIRIEKFGNPCLVPFNFELNRLKKIDSKLTTLISWSYQYTLL
jgi:hypothetical protein